MSILLSEAYANPNTPIWTPAGSTGVPTSMITTTGGNVSNIYANSVVTLVYTVPSTLMTSAGMYVATISFACERISDTGDGGNISLYAQIQNDNSIAYFSSGSLFYIDNRIRTTQNTGFSLVLPFYTAGDGSDNITVSISGGHDYTSISWGVSMISSSLQLINSSASQVSYIFN